jgi:hypothetical protein
VSPLGFPTVLQTKSIALNTGTTITNAKVTINSAALSDASDFQWYLSADGGTNWEEITLNTTHTFTSAGNDLRLQVLGNPGATITIRQSDGQDYPLIVEYNL